MEYINRIKSHYGFTPKDAVNLKSLKPYMEERRDDFVEEFYHYVKNFDDTSKYLKDQATIKKHQTAIGEWFVNLCSGEYGSDYFNELERVGKAHVDIDLPAHYVNAAMHFVKRYVMDICRGGMADEAECAYITASMDKILDINLDVFTSSYIEEEKKQVFVSHKVESLLIQVSERFTYGLNLILVLGLVCLGVLVVWLFITDLMHVFDGNVEKGLLHTLGSLLMLWVVIELMETEIGHLRGKAFAVKVFISVALVAMIRKILIATLSKGEGSMEIQLTLMAGVAVLGGVYWLISKTEKK